MGMITSRKISCTIDDELVNDKLVTFTAPCDSTGVTALVINGTEFTLVDSTGMSVSSCGDVFASGSKITVSLDVTNAKAYILNAANTNGTTRKYLVFNDTSITTTSFNSDTTYDDFPYRAAINLTDVTASMIAEIIFGCSDATSGNFAPVCATYNGGVYIYAKAVPDAAITIPTIIVWR